MPELPDVEGFRRDLAAHAVGRRVEHVRVRDRGVLRGTTPQRLARALHGRRLDEPGRHGKWLLVRTDGPTVLVHPGMTGNVAWATPDAERPRFERAVLSLDDGSEIRYADMRKLRGLWLLPAGEPLESVAGPLGPDADGIRRRVLADRLAGRRRAVKAALMDQEVVAGLGNLLSDEILWRAGVHPRTRTDALDEAALARLHRETVRVLRAAVPAGRVPGRRRWLTGQRDEPDPRCPRCGTALRKDTVGGRSARWCPSCQPEPRR